MLDQAASLRNLVKKVNDKDYHHKVKIITVTSGKGGVGKSNFVVNLSIHLQKLGKKVLILDADVGMGNDDVIMGIASKYNIYDAISGEIDLNKVMVKGPLGVMLLPAGSGICDFSELGEEKIQIFIKKLTYYKEWDYIIMDTGAGINRTVLGFINCCDDLIVLTTPEPTSLKDAYGLIKAVSYFKLKTKAKLVVNRTIDSKEGIKTYKNMRAVSKRFLDIDLDYLGSVSEDRKITQSIRKQNPFTILYPKCKPSRDILDIANKVLGFNKNDNGLGVDGLFKKLFSIFS